MGSANLGLAGGMDLKRCQSLDLTGRNSRSYNWANFLTALKSFGNQTDLRPEIELDRGTRTILTDSDHLGKSWFDPNSQDEDSTIYWSNARLMNSSVIEDLNFDRSAQSMAQNRSGNGIIRRKWSRGLAWGSHTTTTST